MVQVVDRDERHVQALIRNLRWALQLPAPVGIVGVLAKAALGDETADPSPPTTLVEPSEALRSKYPDRPYGAIGRRFAFMGHRPILVTRRDACTHCGEYGGVLFNPLRAPLLPLEHCKSLMGCRCRYR